MVGLVVVSHSEALAEGVVALAREMGGEELALEAAGGMDEPGALGTDAERVRAAIERAMSDDGVLVLMDLGSALMSTEFAIEMLEIGPTHPRVLMSEAPLVEGTVAAAVAARDRSPTVSSRAKQCNRAPWRSRKAARSRSASLRSLEAGVSVVMCPPVRSGPEGCAAVGWSVASAVQCAADDQS